MIEKIKALLIKYEEIISYLVVGVLTTIVSWGAKALATILICQDKMNPNEVETTILAIVNWTSGVAFAFPFNRKFVFKSKGPFWSECGKFWGSRIPTFLLDWFITMILGPLLGINVIITTLASAVLVTILNYIFSKVFVFRKKKTKDEE